jgi:hypothetical protein
MIQPARPVGLQTDALVETVVHPGAGHGLPSTGDGFDVVRIGLPRSGA